VRQFVAQFRSAYGHDPDVAAALGFDAVNVLVAGMRAAKSVAPDAVSASLHSLRGLKGVTGAFSFDQAGNPIDLPIHKLVVSHGAFRYLEESGDTNNTVNSVP
jgi:ABC-type branched-subunit amino acid transport system substrate-binding protein